MILISQSQGLLPSIPFPAFDGKYENWAVFENISKVMVDSHADVTSNEKYNYLQWHLRVKHFIWFVGLPIITENYSIAWVLWWTDMKSR